MYTSSEVVIPAFTCVIGLLLLGRHIIGQDRRTRGNSSVQASVCAHGPDRVTTSDHEPAVPRHSGGRCPTVSKTRFHLRFAAPGVGLEPTTYGLTVRGSGGEVGRRGSIGIDVSPGRWAD